MTYDSKEEYLFAFARAFGALCGGERIAKEWNRGMWSSAHMYYTHKVSPEGGARLFFDDIMKYPSNRKKLDKLRRET